jgi:hypothetical protein
MKWKTTMLASVLGALVMLGGAGVASAQNRYRDDDRYRDDACYRKIEKERRELDRAIERHGFYSRQADHERRELRKLQARCSYRYDRR